MPFGKGVSGNPNGRPKKERTLSAILEKAGNAKVDTSDNPQARKYILADLLWSAATTRKVQFGEGEVLELPADDWLQVAKFIYSQIDGAPKQQTEIGGIGGQPIQQQVVIEYVNAEDNTT